MRLIDADALKEAFYNRHRTPDDEKYLRVPAEVVYQFIDNAPTVDAYSEGYTDSTLLFADEIKEFINTHEQTLHTDFSRGYQKALNDLLVYFVWRGVITDENSNQNPV